MENKKLYQTIKEILHRYPETRSNDKALVWKVWETQGITKFGGLDCLRKDAFLKQAIFPDTITRVRRAIQASNKQLQANDTAKGMRVNTKPQTIYTRGMPVYNNEDDTVMFI